MAPRGGFILLHRKLLDSQMWEDMTADQRSLMIRLLLLANWKPSVIRWGGADRLLNRGQVLVSLRRLAEYEGCSYKTARSTIEKLMQGGALTAEKRAHCGTILTWLNYEKYQDFEEAEGRIEGTIEGRIKGTHHNKRTSKQENKEEAKPPSEVAAKAATAISWTRRYVGQATPRALDRIDIMAVRRAVKAGLSPADVAARAYVGIAQCKATSVAHALGAGFSMRVEKHGSLVEHHSAEIRRRFGNDGSVPAVGATEGPEQSVGDRLQASGFDLGSCERALGLLGGEAGLIQNDAGVADWLQSRLARKASPVDQRGAVDGADDGDVRGQDGEDSKASVGAARRAVDARATGEPHERDGSVQEAPHNLSLFGN